MSETTANRPASIKGQTINPLTGRPGRRVQLLLGACPGNGAWVRRACDKLRVIITQAVESQGIEVDVKTAGLIQTACRYERAALLAGKWLRERYADLDDDQRLKYLTSIADLSAKRDAALARLPLGTGDNDPLAALRATIEAEAERPTPSPPASPVGDANANQATEGDTNG